MYAGTINSALGTSSTRIVAGEGGGNTTYYASEYGDLNAENLQKLIADAYGESVLEQEEGSVLLRNNDGTLPLASDKHVTLFGHAVVQPVYSPGGANSAADIGKYVIDLKSALEHAGFSVNNTLFDAYSKSDTKRVASNNLQVSGDPRSNGALNDAPVLGEEPASFYTDQLKASWQDDYHDVAIVMLAREGGEDKEMMMKDPEGKPVEPTLVRARIHAENLAWNKVPVKMANVEAEYRPNQLFVQNCRVEMEKGVFELFANGFLDGQMFVMGQSTVPLQTIDQLLSMEDDDFFMNRFVFRKDSGLEFSFQGTLGLYNLEKAYDLQATISATNTRYRGVDLKSARADAHLVTDQLVLTNVTTVVSNGNYLSSAGLSGGPSECTLKAKSIDFRFVQDTVEVLGLEGQAYPGYTLRMFSDSAARVLKEFVFTRPVTLSGGGMFPMGDDMKLMKGRIRFDASAGRVRYPLLGTTLDLGRTKGEVLISPQWVVVDKMMGTIWDGTFTGRVLAQIDDGDALNGSFVLQDMNLTSIGKSYDKKMEKATVHGAIEFSSKGGNMNSIQAKGEAALVHGDLVEIPLFGFLGEALSNYIPGLGHLINYKISRADCDFSIEKGYVRTSNFAAQGSNMSLEGGGWIRLSDLQVNSDFKLGLRGFPGFITSPVFLLAGGLFQVRGTGPLSNVSWSFAPFSGGKAPIPPAAAPARKR